MTWGESHGKAIGVVIDGCPAGLPLDAADINAELKKRRPGSSPLVSPRKEPDEAEILSGLFENKTTGMPISILIRNRDADTTAYEPMKDVLRPSHAHFSYLKKYGIFDWRGGGRASARETATRVAAGAVAKKLLALHDITLKAHVDSVGPCTDPKEIEELLRTVMEEGDSIGGAVALTSSPLPFGLGEPVFDKLQADLAKAMLSLPAARGVEFGEGMAAACQRGSEHNDSFAMNESGEIVLQTNHTGGTLGGISCGQPLRMRVAFKPTSSIQIPQRTLTTDGHPVQFSFHEKGRHDPCVALRAPPIVEAMAALTLADHLLRNIPNI